MTAGIRLHLGGSEENAFTRILRETSAFYRLAFEPEPSQRNGNSHRIELRVSRAGVTVRVRPSILIAKTDAKASRSPANMLQDATVYRDLPLRVTGFVSRQAGQTRLKVVTLAETEDQTVSLVAAAAGLLDADGKRVAQAALEPVQLKGGPFVTAMLVPPGIYRRDSPPRIRTDDRARRITSFPPSCGRQALCT